MSSTKTQNQVMLQGRREVTNLPVLKVMFPLAPSTESPWKNEDVRWTAGLKHPGS